MENNELKKLNRRELLEMLYEQSRRMDDQQSEIDRLNAQLENRTLIMNNAGSIADAAIQLSEIFDVAQKTADVYVDSVKKSSGLKEEIEPANDLFARCVKIVPAYAEKIGNDMKRFREDFDESSEGNNVKLKKEMRELEKEFAEFSKVLRIMEENKK